MKTQEFRELLVSGQDPIKRIEEQVLSFLSKNGGKDFSSSEIHAGLQTKGQNYRLEDVQEATTHLLDAGRLRITDKRKYQYWR